MTRDSRRSSSRLLGLNSREGKKTGKELGDDVENHRVVEGRGYTSPGDDTDCMVFITEVAEDPVNSEVLCSLYCASF